MNQGCSNNLNLKNCKRGRRVVDLLNTDNLVLVRSIIRFDSHIGLFSPRHASCTQMFGRHVGVGCSTWWTERANSCRQ